MTKTYQQGLAPLGEIRPYHDATPPSGWLLCDGSSLARADYPHLAALLSLPFNTVITTSASPTVSIVVSMLPNIPTGAWVEGSGLTSTTVAVGADPAGFGNSFTLSTPVTTGDTIQMTIYPFGCVDEDHFNLPDFRGRVLRHDTRTRVLGGQSAVALETTHVPSHTHGFNDPPHGHTITSSGAHNHPANGDPFAEWGGTVNTSSGTGANYRVAYHPITDPVGDNLVINCGLNNGAGMPATTGSTGTNGVEHPNVQPTLTTAYMIKATP